MKSFCVNCLRPTNHNVLKEEAVSYEDETGWWEDTKYQIIQCMGCDKISFRELYNSIAMQQHYDWDTTTQELYPKRGLYIPVHVDPLLLRMLTRRSRMLTHD
jgi:hypothetical protein